MARVEVKAEVLRWALERSGRAENLARRRYPKFSEWVQGTGQPTLRQLEGFAKWTHTPFGFFLLESPPDDRLPIPDYRTKQPRKGRPSPDLLETIQTMQRRQEWMREFLLAEGEEGLAFIGSASIHDSPENVAQSMRATLGLAENWADRETTWTDALRLLRHTVENLRIMVVVNGVVGNNTHRPLDVTEFRGFALVDSIAPLVFVNGSDARCAQMFTLAHELAHLWTGSEGVSDLDRLQPVGAEVEQHCNRVAGEFLVPAGMFQAEWRTVSQQPDRFDLLARRFKVSSLVVARRAWDLRHIRREDFFAFYNRQIQASAERRARSRGGNFWRTQAVRIGNLFGGAIAQAVWTGRLLYRDAYHLTGLYGKSFDNYIAGLGL